MRFDKQKEKETRIKKHAEIDAWLKNIREDHQKKLRVGYVFLIPSFVLLHKQIRKILDESLIFLVFESVA